MSAHMHFNNRYPCCAVAQNYDPKDHEGIYQAFAFMICMSWLVYPPCAAYLH